MPNTEPVFFAHTPASAASAGEVVLARYRLGRRLGAGGMGTVYEARDEQLERDVAVKRIPIEHDPDGRGEREALAAARLSHPAIVALYESGRDGGAVYLVSELVRGRTLADLLEDGELSDRDIVQIGVALCGALAHAHARGVIHRDVKPSNIICPSSDDGPAAKLTDFGIARMADHDVLTRTGDIIGTIAYMAPEQARGERITGAVDVYALGIVLYEGLAGVNPVRASNPAATVRRVGLRLPALGRVRRDLPAGLCQAIDAAVEPDPAARAKLGALRSALKAAVAEVADVPGPIAGARIDVLDAPRRISDLTRTWRRPPEARGGTLRGRWRGATRGGGADVTAGGARGPARGGAGGAVAGGALGPGVPARRGAGDAARGDMYVAGAHVADAGGRPRSGARERVLAALLAGVLAAAALAWLGPPAPVEPGFAGALAGLAVLAMPRLGWLAAAGLLLVWLAVAAPGVALALAAALVPVVLLLPRSGTAWSLAALAPLAALPGLGAAWPAVAGQAAGWRVRAALGALGAWWLALLEALRDDRLLLGGTPDLLARAAWEESALAAAEHALWPLLSSSALALAALWALAAALLPVFVAGRSAALDVIGVAVWAATLAAATASVAEALVLDAPRGLVAASVLGAAIAVGASALRQAPSG